MKTTHDSALPYDDDSNHITGTDHGAVELQELPAVWVRLPAGQPSASELAGGQRVTRVRSVCTTTATMQSKKNVSA